MRKSFFREIKQNWLMMGIPEEVFDNFLELHQRSFSPVPKGYILPEQVIKSLLSVSVPLEPMEQLANMANWASTILIGKISKNNYKYPWYWLDKNLAQDLSFTDPPESIPKEITLPSLGLILLPKNLIKTSTGNINFILYHLFKPGEKIDFKLFTVNKHTFSTGYSNFSNTTPQDQYRLVWFSAESHSHIYGGNIELIFQEEELKVFQEVFQPLVDQKTELSESNRILSLLLNCLIYSDSLNTEIIETEKITIKKGFGKNSNKNVYSRPLWIGKGYQPVSRQPSGFQGTHASPTPHWRRGHWKRVAFGENRSQRKRTWIKPTLVGLSQKK